jgi:hypothetical protein
MNVGRWLPETFGLELTQRDVDFVIPRLDADIPLCIDPFLLFKSKREELRGAHKQLVAFFNEAIAAFRAGDEERAATLVIFPEVEEIRFGYSAGSIHGRGMGEAFSRLFIESLRQSPELLERGIRHVEELQLLSPGIAEDKISDLAANVLSEFLIEYTQRQAEMWWIPVEDAVPLQHVWRAEERDWADTYESIPMDPATERGILLVPRWIVRRLPWINFDDYARTDFRAFLRSRLPGEPLRPSKPRIAEVTRSHLAIVDQYVTRKEEEAARAQPDAPPLLATAADPVGDELLARLKKLKTGQADAYNYQRLILTLLNTLFEPELIDGAGSNGLGSRDSGRHLHEQFGHPLPRLHPFEARQFAGDFRVQEQTGTGF